MGTDTNSLEDNKKLKNNPELHNIFSLAEKLHKSVSEILEMTVDEFNMWIAYFSLQSDRTRKTRTNSKGKTWQLKQVNIDIIAKDKTRRLCNQPQKV